MPLALLLLFIPWARLRHRGVLSPELGCPACLGLRAGMDLVKDGRQHLLCVLEASKEIGHLGFSHSSAHSPRGLVTGLVALRLARCPWEGWPEQNVFHYHLFVLLETGGFSPSAHPSPDTFLPLVFINSVPFTFFHPLWLSAKEKMSAGLQSSPR